MTNPSKEELISAYNRVSESLGKDEITCSEFKEHTHYHPRKIYGTVDSYTDDIKHEALFRQGEILYKSKDYLETEYLEKGKSAYQIAEEWGVSGEKVHHWLKKNDVPTRDRSEAQTEGDISKLRNPVWLQTEYVGKERHGTDIADEVGVDTDTVYRWLRKQGIKLRDEGQAKSDGDLDLVRDESWLRDQYIEDGKSTHEIASECGVAAGTVKRYLHIYNIETRPGGTDMSDGDLERLNDKGELKRLYWEQRLSMQEIADELNVRIKTVHRKMQMFGIERRGHEECHPSGEEHVQFKADKIHYYGMYWRKQRLRRRIHDQARCQVCGMTDAEHVERWNQVNHVHHIQEVDQFVEDGELNENEAHALSNLTTLCKKHHRELEGIPIDNGARSDAE